MTEATGRDDLHRLIDRLAERDLGLARRFLEVLAGGPPSGPGAARDAGGSGHGGNGAGLHAIEDDDDELVAEPWLRELLEQLTPEELAAVHAADEDEAARLIVEHAERRGILIPDEDAADRGDA